MCTIKDILGPLDMSPVDWAGPVTGLNFALGSYEKFQPGFWDDKRSKILGTSSFWHQIRETKQTWRNTKILTLGPILASATLKAVSLQLNGCLWCGKYSRQCKTMPSRQPEFILPFIPLTGMKCSYSKTSSPLTKILGTEPVRLLIWANWKFYKGFREDARSWKPGPYEEALKVMSKRPVPDTPNSANPRLKFLLHKVY